MMSDKLSEFIQASTPRLKLSIAKTLILSVIAGMFIALAGVGATVATATLVNTEYAYIGRLLGALVFPAGLAMIILAGGELFTGNALFIIPVLDRQAKARTMLRNWGIVYMGNFIGSILVSTLTVYGGTYSLFGNDAAAQIVNTAVAKVSASFMDILLLGIPCNFLVCIAIWMALGAKGAANKFIAMYMPIMLFVLCGFEHSVANMYFIPTGLLAAQNPVYAAAYAEMYGSSGLTGLTWPAMLVNNLLPSTIGNIIGGAGFVGLPYWAVSRRNAT